MAVCDFFASKGLDFILMPIHTTYSDNALYHFIGIRPMTLPNATKC